MNEFIFHIVVTFFLIVAALLLVGAALGLVKLILTTFRELRTVWKEVLGFCAEEADDRDMRRDQLRRKPDVGSKG